MTVTTIEATKTAASVISLSSRSKLNLNSKGFVFWAVYRLITIANHLVCTMSRAGLKSIGQIAPNWVPRGSYLLSTVQAQTTHWRYYRERHWVPHLLRMVLIMSIYRWLACVLIREPTFLIAINSINLLSLSLWLQSTLLIFSVHLICPGTPVSIQNYKVFTT